VGPYARPDQARPVIAEEFIMQQFPHLGVVKEDWDKVEIGISEDGEETARSRGSIFWSENQVFSLISRAFENKKIFVSSRQRQFVTLSTCCCIYCICLCFISKHFPFYSPFYGLYFLFFPSSLKFPFIKFFAK
jgi:hypothetical protein